jgi:hypothetical protein
MERIEFLHPRIALYRRYLSEGVSADVGAMYLKQIKR